MKTLISTLFLFLSLSLYSQREQFSVSTSNVYMFDYQTEKGQEYNNLYSTFIININDRGDVKHISFDGTERIFKRIDDHVETGSTKSGQGYQCIRVISDEGEIFLFQLFDDRNLGVRMLLEQGYIQFA